MAGNGKLCFMIDLTRLRLLVALHEQGTVHAAAATLHISPSAASQQLATLAREAGGALTQAEGRRLRLTDAGRVLVGHAYSLLAQLEKAKGDVSAALGGELGQLTAGSFPSTIVSLLIPAVRTLRQRHPGLRVDIREVTVASYLDALATGDIDVIVAVEAGGAPSEDDVRYTRIALGTDDLVLVLPATHPLAGDAEIELSALGRDHWVSTIEGDSCDQLLHDACAAAGFRPIVRHRASDWLAILALIDAEMGVALVPRSALLPIPGGVVTAVPTGHGVRSHVYAAVRKGAEARPGLAAFLTVLRETAGTA